MDVSLKLLLTLPSWQRKIINQVIKEENNVNKNYDIIEQAKNLCIKTKDERFMFAFAYFTKSHKSRIEIVKELLKLYPSKWALPCYEEITDYFGCPLIDKDLCIDALIQTVDCENLYKFARKFGHNQKILDFLIKQGEVDLILDYAKNIKYADLAKIEKFIEEYTDSSTYIYKERFEKIQKSKIKKSKSLEQSLKFMGEEIEK